MKAERTREIKIYHSGCSFKNVQVDQPLKL